MKYDLRDYQRTLYDKIIMKFHHGKRAVLCALATRGGKSAIASKLIEEFAVNKKQPVYFTCHTKILIDQMSEELTEHEIRHGIIAPYAPQIRYRVQVISKDSLFVRLLDMKKSGWQDPALIIVDEAHLSMSSRYKQILESYPNAKIVGLTGSPVRLDNKPLSAIFDSIVIGPSIKTLQEKKVLCPIETIGVEFDQTGLKKARGDFTAKSSASIMDKPKVLKDIFHHWKNVASGKRTLTFCSTIQHAHDMAEEFTDNGNPAVAISSKDGKALIKEKLADFYSGKYINLCSVNLFLMGFHVKDCECIIQARHTASLMIYLQSLGRGEMYLPGKTLINIDAVNNWERHGLPEDDREWSLSEEVKREDYVSKYRRCPECWKIQLKTNRECEYCGYLWTETREAGSRIPEETEGKLIRIGDKELTEKPGKSETVLAVAKNARNLKEACAIVKKLGYNGRYGFYIWSTILKNGKAG